LVFVKIPPANELADITRAAVAAIIFFIF